MSHAYNTTTESAIESYKRIHGNGEETHVHILSCGDRYLVVAADVDPREFQPVAGETVGYEPTEESAHERATAYMEQHPKGVLENDSGRGILEKILDGLKKLDQSAESDLQGETQ